MSYAYNANPTPTYGTGAYGYVPGQIGMPDPAGDLGNVYPAAANQNKQIGNNITALLGGQLSPQTQMAMQNYEAAYGAGAGMGMGTNAEPGSFSNYRGAADIGKTVEGLQQQGLQDYNSVVPTISQTQTVSPQLQTEIANINSINAAAPNPQEHQQALKDLYLWMLDEQRGPMGEFALGASNLASSVGSIGSIAGSIGGMGGI
jgi:hypothetical protein